MFEAGHSLLNEHTVLPSGDPRLSKFKSERAESGSGYLRVAFVEAKSTGQAESEF